MNSRHSKLPSAKVLLKLEFDTEDQVLLIMYSLFNFYFHVLVDLFKLSEQ